MNVSVLFIAIIVKVSDKRRLKNLDYSAASLIGPPGAWPNERIGPMSEAAL